MASIKLKYRPSAVQGKDGVLYYQVIHGRVVKRINTNFRIYPDEWDSASDTLIICAKDSPRYSILKNIERDTAWNIAKFDGVVKSFVTKPYSIDSLISAFEGNTSDGKGVFDFIHKQVERLKSLGRLRCSETMATSLRSFMRFRGHIDLGFQRFDKEMIEQYEGWLRSKGVTRNTSSFYMRNLRSAYNVAVDEGLTSDKQPFRKVYTGVDKTTKRAISKEDFRAIKSLDLSDKGHLEFARDMFMLSFYMRGMPFVDMAYLRKKDLVGGHIEYRRKKTGQQLSIEWTSEMESVLAKYRNDTIYLLPILTSVDKDERLQYQNQLSKLNRNLKKIGELAGLAIPLSSYMSRHGWATIARDMNIPISVISQGLGHDNEKTTQIYLDSIKTAIVDEVNRMIIGDL